MNLNYVPLLHVQRDLYKLPLGFERFQEYLRTMVDAESGDLKLPLAAMNPMGKDHLLPFLERLIEMDADGAASATTAKAAARLKHDSGDYSVGLVVSDDLKGGWTNRYSSEFGYRFEQNALYKRGWVAAILWTSELYSVERVCEEVLTCIFRAAYTQTHGFAHTLGEMIAQESYAMKLAGSTTPKLESDDLAHIREVLEPHLNAKDQPTLIAALFGDEAAHQLGYPPLGLSHRAGLALAASVGAVYDRSSFLA